MKYIIILLLLFQLPVFAQLTHSLQPLLPEIVTQFENVRDFTVSENIDEAYFTAQSPLGEASVIMRIQRVNEQWTAPRIASFSGKYKDLEPFLYADGLRLCFASQRPESESDTISDYDVWMVERRAFDQPWSGPVNLGPPVNSVYNEYYPAVANNGNMYFTSDRPGSVGLDDIFFCEWQHGTYKAAICLSDSINTVGYEFNAFISPEESYLLFGGYNRSDGYGSGDIYISFRKENQSWSAAQNLGPAVNSPSLDYCPFVVAGMLYFTSKRSSVTIPEDGFKSVIEIQKETGKYENGMSRLYQIPISDVLPAN